jgi:hypothetical protein
MKLVSVAVICDVADQAAERDISIEQSPAG